MTAPSAARPIFVVPVKDLDDGPKTVSGELSLDWLRNALEGSEATPTDQGGRLELQLSKNGREVLVRGVVRVSVVVPCARTLAPILLNLSPEIVLLLRRAAAAPERQRGAAVASHDAKPRSKRAKREAGEGTRPGAEGAAGTRTRRPSGNQGTRAQARGGWDDDPELGPMDAAQDTFEGEQIVLDPFLREFILLSFRCFRSGKTCLRCQLRLGHPPPTSDPWTLGQHHKNPKRRWIPDSHHWQSSKTGWRRSRSRIRSKPVAVPKRRKTSSKRDMRRANHDKVSAPTIVGCPNCEAPMIPHRVCGSCGHYKGRAVLKTEESQEG